MKPLLLCMVFLSCSTVLANDTRKTQSEPIETIVVEASRLNQNIYELGSSVYVLTAEDIQARGYDFVVDALAAVPGVTVNQNGAIGGRASVRIRGASTAQTLVLIDGVAVNDPTSPAGGFDFSRLDPAIIERIEVLKGPQSTLWGSDAIGGVVSIVTKYPQEALGGNVFLQYGSFETFRGGAELSGASARGDFRIGVTRSDSQGISKADEDNGNRENDAFESNSYTLQGGLNLPGESRLNITVLKTNADTEFDSFSFGAQGSVGDGDELSETDELSIQANLTVPSFDGRLVSTVVVGQAKLERENFTNALPSFSAEGDRKIYRYQGRLALSEHHQLGFGIEREDTESDDLDGDITSEYLLYEWQAAEALTITMGLRSDDGDIFDAEITGRFALAYQVDDNLTLRGSWGEGFKAPTLFQSTFFCCGATAANTALAPEESDAFDVGLDWRNSESSSFVSVTYFQQDVENLITFSFVGGGYENIAQAKSEGLELSFGHLILPWLGLVGNYAYIDAEDDLGRQLVGVPEHTGDLQFNFSLHEKLKLNVVARYNADEVNSGGTVDEWTRIDVAAQFLVHDNLDLFLRIENIFDEDYQQVLGYGTPGTSVSGGLRMRF